MLGHAGSALRAWLAGGSSTGVSHAPQGDACLRSAAAEPPHSEPAPQDPVPLSPSQGGEGDTGERSAQEGSVSHGQQWVLVQGGQGQGQHAVQLQQEQSADHVVTVREVQGDDVGTGGHEDAQSEGGEERGREEPGEGKCEGMHVCRSASEPRAGTCKVFIGEQSESRAGGGAGAGLGQVAAGGSVRGGGKWLSRSRNDSSDGSLEEGGADRHASDSERGEGRQHGANWIQFLARPSSRG